MKTLTRTRMLLTVIALAMPVFGTACGKTTQAHKGAWVAEGSDHVTLFHFDRDQNLLFVAEQYDSNPLFDGMKIEMKASCKADADSLGEDGRYKVICKGVHMTRASKGLAALLGSVSLLDAYLSEELDEEHPEDATMALQVHIEGDTLTWFKPAKDDKPAEELVFKSVPSHKVAPFMARFREGTVELQFPAMNSRERDLP